MAGSPLILSRAAWGASERIRRGRANYADTVRFAVVHHTAGSNSYTRARSASIVRGIQRYHVLANGWNDIGYSFLVDKYGQIFEGRYGGVDRNVVGAHAQGFNQGSTGVALIGNYDATSATPAAKAALTRLLAWRLDVAHVDPTTTFSWRSTGNPKFPAGRTITLRTIAGHRDTGYTTCPGSNLYGALPALTVGVWQTGLPKLYFPSVTGAPGGHGALHRDTVGAASVVGDRLAARRERRRRGQRRGNAGRLDLGRTDDPGRPLRVRDRRGTDGEARHGLRRRRDVEVDAHRARNAGADHSERRPPEATRRSSATGSASLPS